jgi:hypothetical protein
MSHLLGLYAKGTERLSGKIVDSTVASLSWNGRRKVEVVSEGRLVLARVVGDGTDHYSDVDSRRRAVVSGALDSDASPARATLAAFSEHSVQFPASLSGTFAFAIHDADREQLIVGGDAFGLHPLFIHETEGLFAFSSEYEPLAAIPSIDKSVDEVACAQYFALGSTQGDRTLMRAIARHPCDSVTTVGRSGTERHALHSFDVAIARDASLDDHAVRVYESFRRACARLVRRAGDLPWAITAGIDTRLILGTLVKQRTTEQRFFTRQRFGAELLDDCDILVARLLARHFGLSHEVQPRRPKTPAPLSALFFDERRSCGARTVGGLLGGELLGGGCVTKFSPLRGDRGDLTRMLRPAMRDLAAEAKRAFADEVRDARAENGELLAMFRSMTRAFFATFYGGTPTDWVMPYRLSLTQESPFWDVDFVRAVLAVPFELLRDYGLYRRIYDMHLPELLGFPFETTGSGFPRLNVQRRESPGTRYAPSARALLETADAFTERSFDLDLLRGVLDSENDPVLHAFVDFETWRRALAV